MKKIILILNLLSNSVLCFSQVEFKEWAPLGANWLYWTPTFDGDHHCVRVAHDRDTVVNKHPYKVFDVYELRVVAPAEARVENLLFSYYIGLVGDTVFTYCKDQGKERYYIDRDRINEKIYLFRDCNPTDTVWKKLDTVYYGTRGGTANAFKFKYRVYSSNAQFVYDYPKDTIVEFLPFKHGTFSYHIGENWAYHKFLKYADPPSCNCSISFKSPTYIPDKFECYYDPNLGSYSFWGGQCWLRSAFMSINEGSRKNFRIYPNPTKQGLTIALDYPNDLIYIIYDMTGKYILSDSLSENRVIDLYALPQGQYYLSIQDKSKVLGVEQFIKL